MTSNTYLLAMIPEQPQGLWTLWTRFCPVQCALGSQWEESRSQLSSLCVLFNKEIFPSVIQKPGLKGQRKKASKGRCACIA